MYHGGGTMSSRWLNVHLLSALRCSVSRGASAKKPWRAARIEVPLRFQHEVPLRNHPISDFKISLGGPQERVSHPLPHAPPCICDVYNHDLDVTPNLPPASCWNPGSVPFLDAEAARVCSAARVEPLSPPSCRHCVFGTRSCAFGLARRRHRACRRSVSRR